MSLGFGVCYRHGDPNRTASPATRRRQRVADRGRRADRDHGAGRRRHAADGIRTVDRGVEARHRRAAAAQRRAVGAGVRGLQGDSAISRTQRRHEPRRVPDHLLVGVEPSAARPRHRRGLFAAVPVLSVARRSRRRTEAAAVADLRPRRAAGRGRLVDGGLRTVAAGGSFAIAPRYSSGTGTSDFRGNRLDAAPAVRADALGCVFAAESHQRGAGGVDLRATLSGRTGCGVAGLPQSSGRCGD